MKVNRANQAPAEIRKMAEDWFTRQTEVLARSLGADWHLHQTWIEAFLKEELRQRLFALGWRPKA